MRKFNLLKWGFLCLFCLLTTIGWADTETATTITWPMGDAISNNETSLTCNIEPTTTGITTTYALGSTLSWYRVKSYGSEDENDANHGWYGVTFSEVIATNISQQADEETSANENNAIKFLVTVPTGYTFTPTKISFIPIKDGASDPTFDASWVSDVNDAQNTETTLATGVSPNRPNSTDTDGNITTAYNDSYEQCTYESELSNVTATEAGSTCGLYVYAYKLYGTKSFGLSQVVIEGTLTGDGGTTDPDDGITAVSLNGSEVSYSVEKGETAYFSFTIPEEAGTLTINGDIEYLYTGKDCSGEGIEGDYKSYNVYAYSDLTPNTTYYGKISGTYEAVSGTISATYETTGDNDNGETGDYTITLTSPTAEEIATNGLSDGTITLYSDIPYGAGIMFELYAEGAEDPAYSNWFTPETQTEGEDDNAVTTYTGKFTYEWDSEIIAMYEIPAGTYTFKVTAYPTNNNSHEDPIVATQDLFTFEYVVAEKVTATLTADPANGTTITTNGENQTIELTFDTEVNVTKAQISLGAGSYDEVNVEENENASTTWTLTVTNDQLNTAIDEREGALNIIIYAEDSEGNTVYTEDEMSFFELDYTVVTGSSTEEPTASGYECYWKNDEAVQGTEGFYTFNEYCEIKSNQGSVTYKDNTYDECLHMATGAEISFTTPLTNMELTLIIGTNGSNHRIYLDGTDSENVLTADPMTDDENNVLYYIITETIADAGDHTLSKDDGIYIFYINLEATSESTGINSANAALQSTGNNVYYNLNGQRVSTPSKGIYILNGKKVLIK